MNNHHILCLLLAEQLFKAGPIITSFPTNTHNSRSLLGELIHANSTVVIICAVQMAMPLGLAELRCRASGLLAPLDFSKDRGGNVYDSHESCENGVRDLFAVAGTSKQEPESAVDESQNYGSTANAKMHKARDRPSATRLVESVVQKSSDWLRKCKDEKHNTNDRMVASQ